MANELTKETIQKILDEYNKVRSGCKYNSHGKYFIIDISKPRHNLYVQARQQLEFEEEVNWEDEDEDEFADLRPEAWLDIHNLEMTGPESLTVPELLTKNRIDNMHKFGWTLDGGCNFSMQVTSDELSNGTIAELIYDSYKTYEIPEKLINESAKDYIIVTDT